MNEGRILQVLLVFVQRKFLDSEWFRISASAYRRCELIILCLCGLFLSCNLNELKLSQRQQQQQLSEFGRLYRRGIEGKGSYEDVESVHGMFPSYRCRQGNSIQGPCIPHKAWYQPETLRVGNLSDDDYVLGTPPAIVRKC